MAKRFIDSEIWVRDEWIKSSPQQKLLSIYFISTSSNIGIFDQSFQLVSLVLGFQVTEEMILSLPIEVEKLKNGKYWMPKFCHYQYGELKESCKPHKRYIEDLKKVDLLHRVCKGYTKGINTLEEKEKEKEKDKEKVKEERELFEKLWIEFPNKNGKEQAFKTFKRQTKAERESFIEAYSNCCRVLKLNENTMHFSTLANPDNRRWEDEQFKRSPKTFKVDKVTEHPLEGLGIL